MTLAWDETAEAVVIEACAATETEDDEADDERAHPQGVLSGIHG